MEKAKCKASKLWVKCPALNAAADTPEKYRFFRDVSRGLTPSVVTQSVGSDTPFSTGSKSPVLQALETHEEPQSLPKPEKESRCCDLNYRDVSPHRRVEIDTSVTVFAKPTGFPPRRAWAGRTSMTDRVVAHTPRQSGRSHLGDEAQHCLSLSFAIPAATSSGLGRMPRTPAVSASTVTDTLL